MGVEGEDDEADPGDGLDERDLKRGGLFFFVAGKKKKKKRLREFDVVVAVA